MTTKINSANSLIHETVIDKAVDRACRRNKKGAFESLKSCGLISEQTTAIKNTLREFIPNHSTTQHQGLKERIVAVLKNEAVDVTPQDPVELMDVSVHPLEIIDFAEKIFVKCFSRDDIRGLQALACTSVKLYENITSLADSLILKLCPELTILDAETQGITVDDEPCIGKLAILRSVKDLAPHVENNKGLTFLTMTKGLTLNQLVAIAAKAGIKVDVMWDKILQELGDVPVEQTYVILITNSIFVNSRSETYAQLKKRVEDDHGSEMPTVQEYVALCVFTNQCFQKCLYEQGTYGRTSTHVGNYSLVVGGSALGSLGVNNYCHFGYEPKGAGGRRKF